MVKPNPGEQKKGKERGEMKEKKKQSEHYLFFAATASIKRFGSSDLNQEATCEREEEKRRAVKGKSVNKKVIRKQNKT